MVAEMALAERRKISRKGKLKLASWTIFGTLGCVAISVTYNATAFWSLGHQAWIQGIISAIVLPVILAGPLFFYLTLKLRETVVLNHRLRELASVDGLTACLNRTAFTHRVESWLGNPAWDGIATQAAMLLIDVDHFKQVNDEFGHIIGDETLQLIANLIRQNIRDSDIAGRMGGEEFAAFLPGASPEQARFVAERIRLAVHNAVVTPVFGSRMALSVSIGLVSVKPGTQFSEIYKSADQMLYSAKNSGRNRVVTSTGAMLEVANDDSSEWATLGR
jgi:diguanylate cyclase (GGDEF)-like protein